jgi:hypothetical protein
VRIVSSRILARAAALLAALTLSLTACEREPIPPHDGPGSWILVDLNHTRLQNPVDHRLAKWNYRYQGVHGYSRLFDHLKAHGYPWSYVKHRAITPELLKGYKVLFINLLHKERPDFTPDEVAAIQSFVKAGGGLFMIVDHTNVYLHAERANRILAPMGVEVMYNSAIDSGAASVSGTGWIAITHHREGHPVNDGIKLISFQTGGTLKTEQWSSTLSDNGFADLWNPETDGFYGDWAQGEDQVKEPRGRIPVVAAAEYGAGRVVVVGDQNIYGDAWLGFADNMPHALNAFEWLAHNEASSPRLREQPVAGTQVSLDIYYAARSAGRSGDEDYYAFFVNMNRDPQLFTSAVDDLDRSEAALILPSPARHLPPKALDAIRDKLDQGERVVILMEPDRITQPTVSLLHALAPDFELSARGTSVMFDGQPAQIAQQLRALKPVKLDGERDITSSRLKLTEGRLAALNVSHNDAPGSPYLWDVTSEWGEPLVQTAGEPRVDIARIKRVGKGELIVFLQDGFWRNRTMGKKETQEPSQEGRPAVVFQYDLMDYLKTPLSP